MSVDGDRALFSDHLLSDEASGAGRLLRTSEVARLFQVSERAVTDWAHRGRIPSLRTPGGHHRYPADAVLALLEGRGTGERA